MNQVQIQATALSLTPGDISARIPADVLAGIKVKDRTPFFQAYSIVQEGISRPRVIGEGTRAISWPRAAVQTLAGIVKKGLQFFLGHNADSSHTGRRAVGEVIADFQTTVSGVLHHIVVGYFPDKGAARNCDVCSIEAEVDLRDDGNVSIAEKVSRITGIALGNSAADKPAFPGAVRLGMLQAFDPADEKGGSTKGANTMPTFEEVVSFVRANKVWPSQIFDESVLKEDRTFGKIIEERDTLKTKAADLERTLAGKDKEIETVNRKAASLGARDRLVSLFPQGLTDKQKTFITKKFDPEKASDLSDTGIQKFIVDSQAEFAEVARLFEPEKKISNPPPNPGGDGNGHTETSVVDAVVGLMTNTKKE